MDLNFVKQFLYSQWFFTPPEQTQSFAGQTIIVTGATAGLGLESAKQFIKLGASKVILAVRDVNRGAKRKSEIEELTGVAKDVIEVWHLDLSSYESVKEFASKAQSLSRIDVLLENAGLQTMKFALAEEDEGTITTNVVSTFLLALLMLPKLREVSIKHNIQPHLVIVASEVHFWTKLPERNDPSGSIFGTLADKTKARMFDRYNVSKLLEIFAVRQIVKDYLPIGSPVILNALNPGLVHTELIREVGILGTIMKYAMGARKIDVGARSLINAASIGPESHGKYLSDCKVSHVAPFVESEEGKKTQKRVWDELLAKLEKISPGITKNLRA